MWVKAAISDAILRRLTEDDKRTGGGACQRCESIRAELHRLSPVRGGDQTARPRGARDRRDGNPGRLQLRRGDVGESCEVVEKVPFETGPGTARNGSGGRNQTQIRQCLAVANWAAGHPKAAVEHARRACEEADSEAMIFSCWRYRVVRRDEFVADMEAILALIWRRRKPDAEVARRRRPSCH